MSDVRQRGRPVPHGRLWADVRCPRADSSTHSSDVGDLSGKTRCTQKPASARPATEVPVVFRLHAAFLILRPERPKYHSPGQRPGYLAVQQGKPCKGEVNQPGPSTASPKHPLPPLSRYSKAAGWRAGVCVLVHHLETNGGYCEGL